LLKEHDGEIAFFAEAGWGTSQKSVGNDCAVKERKFIADFLDL
jgi:hypothetical protein